VTTSGVLGVTTESILGAGAGSEYTNFYVSNNGGINWLPIAIGETTDFATNDYKLKFKVVLGNVLGATPILDYIKFDYAAYPSGGQEEGFLQLNFPAAITVGDTFTMTVTLVDSLGFPVEINGGADIAFYWAGDLNTVAGGGYLPYNCDIA